LILAGVALNSTWVPWLALGVAFATLLFGQLEVRRRAKVDYVAQLEHRIETCEHERAKLREDVKELRERELDLMRRVYRLEGNK
jgi:hypothetical protein